ncbi:AAA family ATPase [Mycolicibacterium sp. TY81]|uniref:AAA family ATPase n=1 Tax=Mycolicibacterium sp. TY81 TaxID=2759662 RepID=UPI001FD2982B|nr:AAA family ATPase [Mycolicibacterium sp. TY81]
MLVVDEAHLLDNHQLEAIRLLTNHDMDSGSPFAAVLVGQPTLRHRLRLGVLAALDQRIAVRYTPARDESGRHRRLHRPSHQDRRRSDALFADDAITLIHNASRGHPPRSQQPRPARPDRRVRRRAFHRRGESRTHRHQRNSNRLNQIHVTTATTTPPRQGSRHRDHQRPARHKRAGAFSSMHHHQRR